MIFMCFQYISTYFYLIRVSFAVYVFLIILTILLVLLLVLPVFLQFCAVFG